MNGGTASFDMTMHMVYDNSYEKNDFPNLALRETVLNEFRKRRDKLEQADEWIMDYIKELVYPQLNRRSRTSMYKGMAM